MKAIVLRSFGNADQLEWQDVDDPVIQPDEVLIRTKAISINPVDAKTRKGKGQAPRLKGQNPMIIGWDVSGVVTAVGKNVSEFREGDEVFGMINVPGIGKTYAELVAAPAAHIALKPAGVSHEKAAAACLAALTAWQAVSSHGKVTSGQKVLVHAASGGVGHFAVQMAKSLGAYVIGTSSAANRELVLGLGADEHIDYTVRPFEEVAPQVDFILDPIGGEHIDHSLRVLKKGGTIISLPSGLSESVGEKAAAQGKKGIFFLVHSSAGDMRHIASMLATGTLRPFVSAVYPFRDIRLAHDQIETGKTVGKIVLTWE